jgi:imidazolonepropionase-like amidohydrolase
VAAALRAGVTVVAGSDAGSIGVDHGSGLWAELWLLREAGLSAPQAVAAATHEAARLLGLEGELGELSPGRAASFVAVRGQPSDLFQSADRAPQVVVRRGGLVRRQHPPNLII